MKIEANDPELKSWLTNSDESDFPLQNLPFGIFKTHYLSPGAGVAIGNKILDLTYLHGNGFLDGLGLPQGVFNQSFLNEFIGLGRKKTSEVRKRVSQLLRHDNGELRDNSIARELALIDMRDAEMLLPIRIPNYTDFYSSEEHATNVGTMFRDPENALLPNWKHMPVGYHGRASSIVVSGTDIIRPRGQMKSPDQEKPVFGPSKRLDFELEMAFITCSNSRMGGSISLEEAEENIFGMVLFNDWSARDIQVWEYVPLGPFLGKNFASSISPWIVTMDALEPFRVEGPKQNPSVLPYLEFEGLRNFDIELEVSLLPENSEETVICTSNSKYLYWNIAQQLAHHTINGCNIQVGDIYASGTISGPKPEMFGSMLELAWKGTKPIQMKDGSQRVFINDNDTITMKGYCKGSGYRIGFGEVSGKILPSLSTS